MGSVDWSETSVDVGWGVLRGKRSITGDSCRSPILRLFCIHGWLDNANSFDRLIPLLPAGIEVFVLDLPGHGKSDHLPSGAHYSPMAYVINVRAVVLKLGWKTFALMAHSMGCQISAYYTALFPTDVLAFILLDYMSPYHLQDLIATWRWEVNHFLQTEKSKRNFEVYSEEDALKRLVNSRRVDYNGAEINVDYESAKLLLPRSAREVTGGFTWCHDNKARVRFTMLYGDNNWLYFLARIKCPVLLVRASKGICIRSDSLYEKVLDVYNKNAKVFHYVVVEGTHHLHLTHPLRVSPVIHTFLSEIMNKQDHTSSKL